MRRSLSVTVLATLVIASAQAADRVYPGGGVFTHIVDGAGTQTVITLVNMDSQLAPYSLEFFDDNGSPLTLSTTAGVSSKLTGSLPSAGSVIITTNGGGSTPLQGWALLSTNVGQDSTGLYHSTIAGTAVFTLALPSNPISQATVPLDTSLDSVFALPFDHTAAVTGVALANPNQPTPLTVNVTAYDLNGNAIPTMTTSIQIPGKGHTAFMLTDMDRFPELGNPPYQQGIIVFTPVVSDQNNNPYASINALGLRANLAGTSLSTVTPIVPCYYVSNSNGTGCSN